MALYQAVVGDGTLREKSAVKQIWYYWRAGQRRRVTQTTTTETREWVALTRAAAVAWLAEQWGEGESRRIRLDVPALGAYSAESTVIAKTITDEEDT